MRAGPKVWFEQSATRLQAELERLFLTPTMPQDVPDDVWLDIMEFIPGTVGFGGRNGLQSMSLTCKRLRRFALSILYRALQFSFPSERSLDDTRAALVRARGRADLLRGQRHLLQHVRKLSLTHWDAAGVEDVALTSLSTFTSLSTYDDLQDVGQSDSVGRISATIYDLVARLVSHMPALQHLELWQSSMTYILYDAVCSRPLLTSLHVSTVTSGDMYRLNIPIEFSCLPYIRHLHYMAGYSHSAEHYLAHILAHCILHLESLGIHSSHLSLVLALISNHALSIESLHITFPIESTETTCSSAMWDLLHSSPDLRLLRVHGNPRDALSPGFGSHHLPHLVDIYGTISLVRALAGGKNITSMHITQVINIESQHIVDVLSCSTTALLDLTMRVFPGNPDNLFAFLGSLSTFRNLQYMRVSYQLRNIDWNVEMDIQRVRSTVGGILCSFSNLHICHIYNEYHEVYGGNVGCPIGADYDPRDRGHSSLERLRIEFLSMYMWQWIPQKGWTHSFYTTEDWI